MQEEFPIEHYRQRRKWHRLWAAGGPGGGEWGESGNLYPFWLFCGDKFFLMASYEFIKCRSNRNSYTCVAKPVVWMADHPFRQSELQDLRGINRGLLLFQPVEMMRGKL